MIIVCGRNGKVTEETLRLSNPEKLGLVTVMQTTWVTWSVSCIVSRLNRITAD